MRKLILFGGIVGCIFSSQTYATTWSKAYGGGGPDEAWSIYHTSDSGFIVAGYTSSYGVGYADFYIIRTDANGIVPDTIGGICEGFDCSSIVNLCSLTVMSPTISTDSVSIGADCSPIATSPTITVTTVCEEVGIEEILIK